MKNRSIDRIKNSRVKHPLNSKPVLYSPGIGNQRLLITTKAKPRENTVQSYINSKSTLYQSSKNNDSKNFNSSHSPKIFQKNFPSNLQSKSSHSNQYKLKNYTDSKQRNYMKDHYSSIKNDKSKQIYENSLTVSLNNKGMKQNNIFNFHGIPSKSEIPNNNEIFVSSYNSQSKNNLQNQEAQDKGSIYSNNNSSSFPVRESPIDYRLNEDFTLSNSQLPDKIKSDIQNLRKYFKRLMQEKEFKSVLVQEIRQFQTILDDDESKSLLFENNDFIPSGRKTDENKEITNLVKKNEDIQKENENLRQKLEKIDNQYTKINEGNNKLRAFIEQKYEKMSNVHDLILNVKKELDEIKGQGNISKSKEIVEPEKDEENLQEKDNNVDFLQNSQFQYSENDINTLQSDSENALDRDVYYLPAKVNKQFIKPDIVPKLEMQSGDEDIIDSDIEKLSGFQDDPEEVANTRNDENLESYYSDQIIENSISEMENSEENNDNFQSSICQNQIETISEM